MLCLRPAATTGLRYNHLHIHDSPFLAISKIAITTHTTAHFSFHYMIPFKGGSTSSRNEDINFAQRQLI